MIAKKRRALFLAICRAVQHAHQKGLIHCDQQGGAAAPKVIDFGIAKATDKWAVENTLLTQFRQIVGTSEYTSPEQADTMTGDIDEAGSGRREGTETSHHNQSSSAQTGVLLTPRFSRRREKRLKPSIACHE